MHSRGFRAAQLALVAIALVCALAIDFGGAIHSVWRSGQYVGDFTVFWTAARLDPAHIYDIEAISRRQTEVFGGLGARPFVNPPSLLPWLRPFGAMPFYLALGSWVAIGAAAFWWSIRGVVRLRLVPLIVLAPPSFLAVATGQVSPLTSAAIVAAILRVPTQPFLSGALLGLVATMKPQAVLLAPLGLVAGRHWRALGAALLTGLSVGVGCVVVQGPKLWLSWLDTLGAFLQISQRFYLIGRGLTPASLAYVTGLPGPPVIALGAIVGVVTVCLVFRRTTDPMWRIVAMVAGSILCCPYAMPYEAIPLVVPAAMMLTDHSQPTLRWAAGFLVVSGLLLPVGILLMAVTAIWVVRSPRPVLANA